jgi:hypothetical protein
VRYTLENRFFSHRFHQASLPLFWLSHTVDDSILFAEAFNSFSLVEFSLHRGGLFEAANACGNVVMRSLAWNARAPVAMAGGDDQSADESLRNAFALLDNGRAPIATWQIHATAANFARRKREPVAAEEHRKAAFNIIVSLGNSFQADHPLRKTLLGARPLSRVLQLSRSSSD